uniref:NADP-dependent oxidoreductase domain-containing protein n=3 Tax=Parascaris TaxID=6254 RepID=A0A915ALN3_PARUN
MSEIFKNAANSLQASENITPSGRRSSNSLVPPLTRLRIQQCFKAARPLVGQQILKRACILRSEMRLFLAHLSVDMVDELATDLYSFISNCVENIDDTERINVMARAFGEQHAALCSLGFRPDYFAPIADAAIIECVKLDDGAHKRCETLFAWSQLIAAMFTGVRDGYYERALRQSFDSYRVKVVQRDQFDFYVAFLPIHTRVMDGNSLTTPLTYMRRFHNEESVRRMEYKRLGSTDMFVSRIALGCGPIGGLFDNIEDSITQIVECAIKSGINFIDTAYWYGQGRSEEILGKVLVKIPRKAYYISTKVGRFELDYARTFDFRADKILENLTLSLKKLRLPFIDVCFVQSVHRICERRVHCVRVLFTLYAMVVYNVYDNVIGYSFGSKKLLWKTGRGRQRTLLVENSTVQVDVIMPYCHGALNDNALGEYMKFFESKNIGVLNASPLSMGLLTEKGPPPWHPAPPAIRETTLAATQYCSSKKIAIEKLAIDYAVNFPGVCSCVVGMDSVQQVLTNIEITCTGLREVEQRLRDRIMRR